MSNKNLKEIKQEYELDLVEVLFIEPNFKMKEFLKCEHKDIEKMCEVFQRKEFSALKINVYESQKKSFDFLLKYPMSVHREYFKKYKIKTA